MTDASSDPATADTEFRWLCADPVHLRIERDHLQCVPPGPWSLSDAEAAALVQSLNAHLATDGLALEIISATEWLLLRVVGGFVLLFVGFAVAIGPTVAGLLGDHD